MPGMEYTDWHIFLGVAQHGSTLGASRSLRVSQSTVSRRIDALETALNVALFDRRPSGYVLTPAGRLLVPRAELIVSAIAEALGAARQIQRGMTGEVKFTAPVGFVQTFLIAAIQDFRLVYPDISIEVVASEDRLDLLKGDADVALRTGPRPETPGLVARRVLTDSWSVYCSPDYFAAHGAPRSGEELKRHHVIALSKGFRDIALARWLDTTVPESAIVVRTHDIPGVLSGLTRGLGVGLMSDTVAAACGLHLCFVPPVIQEAPVWLITTEHMRNESRIRAFVDYLAGYMTQGRYRKAIAD